MDGERATVTPGAISLGQRLAELRAAAKLTHRQLASELGLKSHTDISQWERGQRRLPPAHLRELARLLDANLDELQKLHEAADLEVTRTKAVRSLGLRPARGGAVTNIDARRISPNFVGRADELAAITAVFKPGVGAVAAVHGAPGIGKSQLAMRFAATSSGYELIWLIPAGEAALIPGYVARLGELAGWVSEANDALEGAEQVVQELCRRDRWLLVFDNAAGPDVVRPFAAIDSGGHILVTSRNPAWRSLGAPIAVEGLDDSASTQLLRRRSGASDDPAELVARLHGHPLAIEQAAALIEESGTTFAAYVHAFDARPARVLAIGTPGLYHEHPHVDL